jgi:hypothetical protein
LSSRRSHWSVSLPRRPGLGDDRHLDLAGHALDGTGDVDVELASDCVDLTVEVRRGVALGARVRRLFCNLVEMNEDRNDPYRVEDPRLGEGPSWTRGG